MYQDPKDVPMPEPTVKYGEYAGPPGEGAHCDLWDVDEMRAYAKDYAAAKCAALSARVAELEADALKLRGQYGVALDLLTECVYPMKVCAAVVENEVDDDGLEKLIDQVIEFIAHARGVRPPVAAIDAARAGEAE